MKNPKISIITVIKNNKEYIEKNILSLINQNYKNYEHIIIDGGSTDGSKEIIQNYRQNITHFVSEKDEEDEIEYKYLNDIVINNISLTSNFIFEKQVGSDAKKSTEFAFSNYLKFQNFLPYEIDFGVFGFSEFGEISGFEVFDEQTHQYGLQFEKELHINDIEFEFALGWLHGFTNASADQTFIWNLEVKLCSFVQ